MVLQFPNDVRAKGRKDNDSGNNRDNPNRPMQDRLMTDNVIEFPSNQGMEHFYNTMYSYDLEVTDLTTEAIELGLPVMTIVGVLQAQVHFLLSLENQEDEDE
jgi:hypothetical protein